MAKASDVKDKPTVTTGCSSTALLYHLAVPVVLNDLFYNQIPATDNECILSLFIQEKIPIKPQRVNLYRYIHSRE